jgi:hypothetical protein
VYISKTYENTGTASIVREISDLTMEAVSNYETITVLNMTVFWDDVPCSLIKVYRRFRGA